MIKKRDYDKNPPTMKELDALEERARRMKRRDETDSENEYISDMILKRVKAERERILDDRRKKEIKNAHAEEDVVYLANVIIEHLWGVKDFSLNGKKTRKLNEIFKRHEIDAGDGKS